MAIVLDNTTKTPCHCCGESNELGVAFCWRCAHFAQKPREECPASATQPAGNDEEITW